MKNLNDLWKTDKEERANIQTEVYELISDRKTIREVSDLLDIDINDVIKLFKEYCKKFNIKIPEKIVTLPENKQKRKTKVNFVENEYIEIEKKQYVVIKELDNTIVVRDEKSGVVSLYSKKKRKVM